MPNYLERGNRLILWARVGKAGELKYHDRVESISEEMLFDSTSLDTLIGIPVVYPNHPPKAILNDKQLQDNLQKGVVLQSFYRDNDGDDTYLVAPILVWDEELIDSIKAGNTGVSPGYFREVEQGQQRNRRYDHIAILQGQTPRNGERNTTLLQDSQDFIMDKASDTATATPVAVNTPPAINAELIKAFTQAQPVFDKAGIEPNFSWTLEQLQAEVGKLVLMGKLPVLDNTSTVAPETQLTAEPAITTSVTPINTATEAVPEYAAIQMDSTAVKPIAESPTSQLTRVFNDRFQSKRP